MIKDLLTEITTQVYSRSDVAYRIGVLKEFFEFVFFTAHATNVNQDVIKSFSQKDERPHTDIVFLESLSASFFEEFSSESFHQKLNSISDEVDNLPTLSIVVPIVLGPKQIESIGKWARLEVSPDVLLDVDIDQSISVGCQIVWHSKLHEFGFEYYLEEHRLELENKIRQTMPTFPLHQSKI